MRYAVSLRSGWGGAKGLSGLARGDNCPPPPRQLVLELWSRSTRRVRAVSEDVHLVQAPIYRSTGLYGNGPLALQFEAAP